MPNGPVEDTGSGPHCAFCGIRNPDQIHLSKHSAFACVGMSKKPFKTSRKPNLVKHLALHGVSDSDGSVLADKWRYSRGKVAFSCGFCIDLFFTITDRLSHIDNEHYKKGQHMSAWDMSKVIKGLLLQPGVNEAWSKLVAQDPSFVESSFSWDKVVAQGLQLRLEMGEETSEDLATAAFELAVFDCHAQGQDKRAAVRSLENPGMDFDTSSPRIKRPTTVEQMQPSNTMPYVAFDPECLNAAISRSRPAPPCWGSFNTSQPQLLNSPSSPPQKHSGPLQSITGTGHSRGKYSTQTAQLHTDGGKFNQTSTFTYPPPAASLPQNLVSGTNSHTQSLGALSENDPWLPAPLFDSSHDHSTMFTGMPDYHNNSLPDVFEDYTSQLMPDLNFADEETGFSPSLNHSPTHFNKPLPSLPSSNRVVEQQIIEPTSEFQMGMDLSFMQRQSYEAKSRRSRRGQAKRED